MIYILLVISLILENGLSLLFFDSSLFICCFSIVVLFSIYGLLKNDDRKYYTISFIYGVIYDIVFANAFLLNAIIFLVLSFFVIKAYKMFQMNMLIKIFVMIFLIVFYRVCTYLLIIGINHLSFDINALFKSIYSSLIINIIYMFILHFITFKRVKKLKRY